MTTIGLRGDHTHTMTSSSSSSRRGKKKFGTKNDPDQRMEQLAWQIPEDALAGLLQFVLDDAGGSAPLGKLGSIMHKQVDNHKLPTVFKHKFGGLRKFILRHPDRFNIATDHPYNPTVELQSSAAVLDVGSLMRTLALAGGSPPKPEKQQSHQPAHHHHRFLSTSPRTSSPPPQHQQQQFGGAHQAKQQQQQRFFAPQQPQPQQQQQQGFMPMPFFTPPSPMMNAPPMNLISAGLNTMHLENQRFKQDNVRLQQNLTQLSQSTRMRDKLITQLRSEVIALRHALSEAKKIAPQIKCVCPAEPSADANQSEDVLKQLDIFFALHNESEISIDDEAASTAAAAVAAAQQGQVSSPQSAEEGIPMTTVDAVCINSACAELPDDGVCHKPCLKRVAAVHDIETLPSHLMPQNMLQDK